MTGAGAPGRLTSTLDQRREDLDALLVPDAHAPALVDGPPCGAVQLELLPEPPASRPDDRTPWPLWPQKYRLSYAMEEAKELDRGEQDFSVTTTHLSGEEGRVTTLHAARAARA